MPLPDTNNWSSRIYELLKETDLENLSYAQFQGVAEKLFIEPENEDELRRLVLVQLARMAVRGDWDGFLNGGGGSGAPADAEYLLAFDASIPASLTAARKLVVGNNISMAHGAGANDDVTLSATPGGSDGQIQYNVAGVLSATGLLSTNKTNELTIVAISGDGQINISSSSKAVSLLCDENQKLKVKGATDTFVLDVSSSSGGITFPDGTTQTTAASGGGGGSAKFAGTTPLTAGSDYTGYKAYTNFTVGALTGVANTNTAAWSGSTSTTELNFLPCVAAKTGTLDELQFRVGTTAGDTLYLGIYASNSDGLPEGASLFTFDTGTTTANTNYTPTISISVTKGDIYWLAYFGQSTQSALWVVNSSDTAPVVPRWRTTGDGINYFVGCTRLTLTGQTNGVFPTLSSSESWKDNASTTTYTPRVAVHIS